jgi:hypothetical protein
MLRPRYITNPCSGPGIAPAHAHCSASEKSTSQCSGPGIAQAQVAPAHAQHQKKAPAHAQAQVAPAHAQSQVAQAHAPSQVAHPCSLLRLSHLRLICFSFPFFGARNIRNILRPVFFLENIVNIDKKYLTCTDIFVQIFGIQKIPRFFLYAYLL